MASRPDADGSVGAEEAMLRGYVTRSGVTGHREPIVVADHHVAALCAAVVVTAVATGRAATGRGPLDGTVGTAAAVVVAVAGVALFVRLSPSVGVGADRTRAVVVLAMVGLALAGLTAARASVEHAALTEAPSGPVTAWVTLVDDPQPHGAATRVIVRHDGRRVEAWLRGRAARTRAESWNAGDRIQVSGTIGSLAPDRAGRVAWQHVVGELSLDWAGDRLDGSPAHRASNRVRGLIATASGELPAPDDTLFRGLVIGDDRAQPPDMLARFRASGLSHLTAVSGQNVAYVLAVAGPLLAGLGPVRRWAVTALLIGWFVMITRFEPSIMRAGVMAIAAASAALLGRERSPLRLLWLTVIALVIVDPLLVSSVGLWLSAGATAGVAGIGPLIEPRLRALGRFAPAVAVTLGAQLGVVVPSLVVFGRLPLSSVPANLLAVPVAGAVMLYGLPAALLTALVPPLAPLVMFPARVGVRWVDTVARLAEWAEPPSARLAVGIQAGVVILWALALVAGASRRRRRHRDRGLLDTPDDGRSPADR
jgi:competence protein ComEC